MAVLVGILTGFGRISSDSEAIAFRASGLSMIRLLLPVMVLGIVGSSRVRRSTLAWYPSQEPVYGSCDKRLPQSRSHSKSKLRVFNQSLTNRGEVFCSGFCAVLEPAAGRYRNVIKGRAPQTYRDPQRKWMAGSEDRIHHYNYFAPNLDLFGGISIFEFKPNTFELNQRQEKRARLGLDCASLSESSIGPRLSSSTNSAASTGCRPSLPPGFPT